MIHNHEVIYNPAFEDDSNYDVQCDLTDQFEEMFPDKCFDTFDEFWNQLKTFQARSAEYHVQADVTTEFVETFASGRFSTYNDFLLRLEEFQQVFP
ncbi:unnamed protein product [Dibothriocephalus latus]|uniref:Uncharacterized protein n=1 Tax=Dibothriocephalus latus TaxID=60516 RepID=A0A3P7MQJ1_DIBLA|nr:unnamed protein product [Dibothriocephalus latus]